MSTVEAGATGATAAAPIAAAPARQQQRSLWRDAWRRFRRHKLAMAGAVVYILLILMTLVGPLVWTTKIADIDFASSYEFSARHPLGTDDLGRDVLARILWGGRISIAVGLCAMVVAITIGVAVGSVAGYFGGWIDTLLSRIIEVFLAVPQLPLLLLVVYLYRNVLVGSFGPELGLILMIVGVIGLVISLFFLSRAREPVAERRTVVRDREPY